MAIQFRYSGIPYFTSLICNGTSGTTRSLVWHLPWAVCVGECGKENSPTGTSEYTHFAQAMSISSQASEFLDDYTWKIKCHRMPGWLILESQTSVLDPKIWLPHLVVVKISMRANVCMDIHSEQPTSHQMLLKWFAPCSTRLGARSGSFFGYVNKETVLFLHSSVEVFLFDDVSIMDDIGGYKPSNVIMVY